jgi:serine/threonine protein kinase
MDPNRTTWVGDLPGEHLVEGVLGEGMYSWVYACRTLSRGPDTKRSALKVAKPEELVGPVLGTMHAFPTQALLPVTGSVIDVQPDADQLLRQQISKLRAVTTAGMPRVLESFSRPGTSYYFMNIAPGKTLRQLMKEGPIKTDVLIALAKTLERLQNDPAFEYHGDLKPENIMVDGNQILILDPGYFGELDTIDGTEPNIAVTTPMYYPELIPDDNHALGLILWEIATGQHALTERFPQPQFDPSRHAARLDNYVRGFQSVGKARFIRGLFSLQVPSEESPDVDADMERFLLASIGLTLTDDRRLELADRAATIGDALSGLHMLKAQGKELFTL